jgi:hypothetical protein
MALYLPSPTVNTKEAMVVMQQLWSNTSSLLQPPEKRAPPPKFNIFTGNGYPHEKLMRQLSLDSRPAYHIK